MFKGFVAYQLAVELYNECSAVKAKPYVCDQLQRASFSIVLNLAEGSEEESPKEKRRFYRMSLRSLRETQSIVHILNEPELIKKADRLGGMVYKLVKNCN